jgi:hypothetical protein
MPRPPFGSPEWLPYFEEIVKTSKRATEAAARMGYRGPGTIRYHMQRFGMAYPRDWSRRPDTSLARQRNIPEVVIPTILGRCWVAGLVQGEACIQSIYRAVMDVTHLELDVSMIDRAPIPSSPNIMDSRSQTKRPRITIGGPNGARVSKV